MRILIGYDGSESSDAVFEDLKRAGLPRDSKALVVSVADVLTDSGGSAPAVSEFDLFSLASRRAEAVLRRAEDHVNQVVKKAKIQAEQAAERLRSQFPGWIVESRAKTGTPAWELIDEAERFEADLIVVGSQERSAIGRFFLGSVSKTVAEEADCSVRVVRRGFEKNEDEPIIIIIGATNLADAERIIEAVKRRTWAAADSQMRLVAIDDGVSAGRISAVYPHAKAIFEQAAERLDTELRISVDIKKGNPKAVLLEAAESWKADSILVFAGGESGLDETAATLITGAKCTVEAVH